MHEKRGCTRAEIDGLVRTTWRVRRGTRARACIVHVGGIELPDDFDRAIGTPGAHHQDCIELIGCRRIRGHGFELVAVHTTEWQIHKVGGARGGR